MSTKNTKTKNKYFVSFVIGYFPALHKFAIFQNYYLYPSVVAKEIGYTPVILIKEGESDLYADPNLPKDIVIVEYKNFAHFISVLTKYSLLRSFFYINNHQPLSYFALIFTKLFFCKNIFMGHIQPKRTNSFRQFIFNFVLLFTDRVRLNNSAEKQFLLSINVPKQKLFIVPIAIDTTKFHLVQEDYTTRKDIVYYGNLTTQKGLPTIFEALSLVKNELPNTCLHIVGSRGNYAPEEDIKKMGLEGSVVLHGTFFHGKELNTLLNSFLVFVISTKAEGQCMAVYESALAGNALCLPKIMSFTETFKNKALFHELGDAPALAKNIVEYLNNKSAIESHNKKVVNMINLEYTEEVVKESFLKLLTF